MKKKVVIVALLILLVPIPMHLNDGGTTIEILGMEIFNNVK